MYKSIEQIEKVRQEKLQILNSVYENKKFDIIYDKQKALGSMAINIYTDVAEAVMPVLREDGVGNIVWTSIAARLERLSFISVPSEAEIRKEYNKVENNEFNEIRSTPVVRLVGDMPKPKTKTKVKRIALPAFLTILAAQGIAIPIILKAVGGSSLALVKVLNVANGACMAIEVIEYFDLFSFVRKKEKTMNYSDKYKNNYQKEHQSQSPVKPMDYEKIYVRAITEVYNDNCKILNEWFERLVAIATEEIGKSLNKE